MRRKMVVPGEKIVQAESEDSKDTEIASTGDSSVTSSPASTPKSWSRTPSPDIPPSHEPSPLHTRSYGKGRKAKDRDPFYKGYEGEGVMCLPGDINGLVRKLQLLAAEFCAGTTTTVRNELVHILDALLRLKQLTRKEYTNITARLAV